jgi:hypothetical protein
VTDIIKDGTGDGHRAKVDAEKRLHVHSFGVTMPEAAALEGDLYSLTSGVVTLTTDGESAIFYIKNNEDDDLFFTSQFTLIGDASGGEDFATITFYIDPTGGTIISNAIEMDANNARFTDTSVLTADTYKGVEGDTLTGASNTLSFVTSTIVQPVTYFVLPPKKAYGVSITPPTGNTSQSVSFGLDLVRNASKYGND